MSWTGADKASVGPGLDAAVAAAAPLGGSLASPGWRYACVAQSTDSEGFLDATDPAVPGAELPAAGEPCRTSWPAAGSPPAAAGCAGSTPEADSSRQLWSPSKRPAQHVAAPAPLSAQHQHHQLGAGGGSAAGAAGAPAMQLAPPPGVDPASYAAGERAAFMMAFQQALPGQQALGQLFSGEGASRCALCPCSPCILTPSCTLLCWGLLAGGL